MPAHDCLPADVSATELVTHLALVHDPRLVLLDEPTNGLDPAGRGEMLGLIQRIGADFGISVIVSSHLLGEVERICDHVVVIDSGRLMRSSTVGALTERSAVLAIEVFEGEELLAARLAADGMEVRADGRLLFVEATEEACDAVRDAVADLELGLVRLERRRHRIEELFRDERTAEEPVHVVAS